MVVRLILFVKITYMVVALFWLMAVCHFLATMNGPLIVYSGVLSKIKVRLILN
jgi:hypothetical protein